MPLGDETIHPQIKKAHKTVTDSRVLSFTRLDLSRERRVQ